ncbi:MAG TPA: FG-GAP-like repeat-containing protein, partial [Xanthomonadaceae bacterium]|nr:FG-GAP-like repeat-containing protein [Xanthomonadaceae bacterium]
MKLRTGLLALCVVLGACARGQGGDAPQGTSTMAAADAAGAPMASPGPALASPPAARLARLPDRGELVAYPGHVKRVDGAYTLYRTDVSEAHALRAMADGHLRMTTPDGQLLDVRYDRHVEHPSGDWTWIGHLPGDPSAQTIITFGDQAAYGSIAQADGKPPLRLTMRDGQTWLVETDPRKVAAIINSATRPTRPDYHLVRRAALPSAGQPRPAAAPIAAAATATGSAAYTVDLLIGYTPGFVSAQGSVSAANTRLNYLVDVANAALANSQVGAQVRLVHTMQVSYTDLNTNDLALQEMSGYKSGTGPVTPNAAFNALRAARETYGADLVSLVRPFKDPEQANCGLAWLLGGAKQGIQPGQGWDDLAYSVVGDGSDVGSDGRTYYCRDETLAHEMGHNEGSAHDRVTSEGGDGVLNDPDDYGAFTYSFGYKTTATTGNFYTVMAYGDSGQTPYRVFSNPRITFCGGRACGTATYEDNARSLGQTIPVVVGFRPTVVPTAGAPAYADFNGDGQSDVLWRNVSTGADVIWRSASAQAQQGMAPVADQAWRVAGVADFDGDGFADVLWRNASTGDDQIWRSANATTKVLLPTVALAWTVAGTGDFNGDGKGDILWRNTGNGSNVLWLSGNPQTQSVLATVADQAWMPVGTGDFDADGKDDILWRNASTGGDVVWRSANSQAQLVLTSVTDANWT